MMYTHILLAVDIEDKKLDALFAAAVDMAKTHQAKITLLSVIPDYAMGMVKRYFPKNWLQDLVKETAQVLEKHRNQRIPADIPTQCEVDRGIVYESILNTASKVKADLIIMGPHSYGHADYLLGPNSAKVMRHSPISVLIHRD